MTHPRLLLHLVIVVPAHISDRNFCALSLCLGLLYQLGTTLTSQLGNRDANDHAIVLWVQAKVVWYAVCECGFRPKLCCAPFLDVVLGRSCVVRRLYQ